jgi:hypothetical protein
VKGISQKSVRGDNHAQLMFVYKIIITIAFIGGVPGILLCLQQESRNIGVTLIISTVTGILGFFGGQSIANKQVKTET